jgi:hypothetical protein
MLLGFPSAFGLDTLHLSSRLVIYDLTEMLTNEAAICAYKGIGWVSMVKDNCGNGRSIGFVQQEPRNIATKGAFFPGCFVCDFAGYRGEQSCGTLFVRLRFLVNQLCIPMATKLPTLSASR